MPISDYTNSNKVMFFIRLMNNNFTNKILTELAKLRMNSNKTWLICDSFLVEVQNIIQTVTGEISNNNTISELLIKASNCHKIIKQEFKDEYEFNEFINQIKSSLNRNSPEMVNELNNLLVPYG